MSIDIALYRARIGLFGRYRTTKLKVSTLLFSHELKVLCFNIIVLMLLVSLRCGDIELNLGPEVSNLSLWSSNVRGLNSLMIDCILADVASKCDFLCICKT